MHCSVRAVGKGTHPPTELQAMRSYRRLEPRSDDHLSLFFESKIKRSQPAAAPTGKWSRSIHVALAILTRRNTKARLERRGKIARIVKAPFVAQRTQFALTPRMAQLFGAKVQAAVFHVLRDHQAVSGKQPVQAAHGDAHLGRQPFGAQRFVTDVFIDKAQRLAEGARLG